MRKLFVSILVVAAFGWIVFLIGDSIDDASRSMRQLAPMPILLAWLVSLVFTAANAELFHLAVEDGVIARQSSYRLFFLGQAARHLPGRFWGIAYQLGEVKGKVAASRIIWAHAITTTLNLYFALWCAACLTAPGNQLSIAAFVAGFVVLASGWWIHYRYADRIPAPRPTNRLFRALGSLVGAAQHMTSKALARIIAINGVIWLLYFASWALVGIGYPEVTALQAVEVAALYSVAWIIGFLAFFTFSGLGVREAAFVGMTLEHPHDFLIIVMVLGRVWFLVNDLILALMATLLGRTHE